MKKILRNTKTVLLENPNPTNTYAYLQRVTTFMISSAIHYCVTDTMYFENTSLRIASPDNSAMSCQMAD